MPSQIDVNRGVSIRRHKKSGMYVYMYKDNPGYYFNVFEAPVNEVLAGEAGFDVKELGKQRRMKEAMAEAQDKIAQELELALAAKKVVIERNGYQVIDIGEGRHYVQNEDGISINSTPIPLEVATAIMDSMFPEAEEAAPPSPEPVPNRGGPGAKSVLFEDLSPPNVEVLETKDIPAQVEPAKPAAGKKAKSSKSKTKPKSAKGQPAGIIEGA